MEAIILMDTMENDHPDVLALPPLIYFGFFCLGLILEFFWRTRIFATLPSRISIGAALVIAGFQLGYRAFREFKRADTNVEVYRPATSLVTSGPYRWTRNPIYIGLTSAYMGAALLADSLWVLGLLAPALVIVHYGVVLREEEYLRAKFGQPYQQYQASVKRWL